MAENNERAITTSPQPISTELADTMRLGEVLSKSGFFSDSTQAAQAVAKILAGRELGVGPVASMTGIYIVKGRITMSANLIAAQIKRARPLYDYRVRTLTDRECSVEFFEKGDSIGTSTITIEEANKAGWTNTDTWRKTPKNMLFARAMSNGAKWYCPDIFSGPVYTPDELGAATNEDGEVIDVTPTPMPQAAPKQERPRIVIEQTGEIIEPDNSRITALAQNVRKQFKRLDLSMSDSTSVMRELTDGKYPDRVQKLDSLSTNELNVILATLEGFKDAGDVSRWMDERAKTPAPTRTLEFAEA